MIILILIIALVSIIPVMYTTTETPLHNIHTNHFDIL